MSLKDNIKHVKMNLTLFDHGDENLVHFRAYPEENVEKVCLEFNEYCNMLKQKAMNSEEAKGNAFIVMMIQQEFNKLFGNFEK